MEQNLDILIVGGGAAGFFAAIRAAECKPDARICIIERGKETLNKVRISGGGRCNVTHACWTPRELSKHYPRGERELLGPFNRFACGDTVAWFDERGVPTKIEEDGRMFPTTDDSQTIVDCLLGQAEKLGIDVRTRERMDNLTPPTAESQPWVVPTSRNTYRTQNLMLATGSSTATWKLLGELGLDIITPVPSLFTFNIKDDRIKDLPGLSVPLAEIKVEKSNLKSSGPLLITHWGLSGPAILKLSAWGARELAEENYNCFIRVNWVMEKQENVRDQLETWMREDAKKQVHSHPRFGLPSRLWKSFVTAAHIPEERRWQDLGKKHLSKLTEELCAGRYAVTGKSTFKEEFVTAGGVDLKEIDLKRFASKKYPTLFMAGEILNIDAITGGFNFQAAWTGGYIAGQAMAGVSEPISQ
jgi:predicted Rossmann fold flavoprotein